MIYNQSGLIRPRYSNSDAESRATSRNGEVSRILKEQAQRLLEEKEGENDTPLVPEPETVVEPKTETRVEPEVKVSAFDTMFFYAREYWWAVALAAFLLGRYLKRKGA